MKKICLLVPAILCLALMCAQAQDQIQTPSVNDLEMVKSLSQKLAVKPEQAAGGAGAIFGFAKSKLSEGDFTKLSESVPGMDQLLKAAPVADASGGLGQAVSSVAGTTGIASLAGPFQKLGMSPDMVGKFVPEILTMVEGKGGSAAKTLLSNVLK